MHSEHAPGLHTCHHVNPSLSQLVFPTNQKLSGANLRCGNDCNLSYMLWYMCWIVNSVASYIIHPFTSSVMIHWRSSSRRVGTVKVRKAKEKSKGIKY